MPRQEMRAARKPSTRAPRPAKPRRESAAATQSGLTPAQQTFALAFLENGFNATRAYQTAHPNATYKTARMEGSRTLAHPCIRAYVNQRLEDAWRPFQMGGEQALARIGMIASADIRDFYDETGTLLSMHLWPDYGAFCVRSVKDGPYGKSITLESPLRALRIILEQTGKLKAEGGIDYLAAALRADLEAHKHIPPVTAARIGLLNPIPRHSRRRRGRRNEG